MRNNKISIIISLVSSLPYFSLDNLASVEQDKTYLKILLSRYEKSGKVYRLKKGLYVTKEYIDTIKKNGEIAYYPEFLTTVLYPSSYLSLDYVLYQHNLLTEIPSTFTAISLDKTKRFSNHFGTYYYHSIKKSLYLGFSSYKLGSYSIAKASKAKALFDFIYLRKNLLADKKAVNELRINIAEINGADKKELKQYIKLEGSKRLKEIFEFFFNN